MTGVVADSALARIAAFATALDYDHLPEPVRELSRHLILDAVGVMFAALDDPVVDSLRRWASRQGAGSSPTLVRADLGERDAAFVIGSAMHALDFDDMAFGGHGTSSVLPGCLTSGERREASGRDLLAAYAAGMEIFGTVAAFGEKADLPLAGWHATSVHAVLGGAAGVARSRGLDRDVAAEALAIACSSGAGVRSALGTMVKALHAGHAAGAAVESVDLAAAGLTGSAAMLEGDGGYGQAYFRGGIDWDALVAALGAPFRMERHGPGIKSWAFCAGTQRAIATLLRMIADRELSPDRIDSITVHVDPRLLRLLSFEWPRDRYEAKFSLRFSLAAVASGRLDDPGLFEDATFSDARFAGWRERIIVIPDRPGARQDVELLVTTVAGEGHRATSGVLHGSADDRMSQDEVVDKYRRNVARRLPEAVARDLEAEILGLGVQDDALWPAWRAALRAGAAS